MEDRLSTREIELELSTEQDIVMPSVLKISSLYGERLTVRTGKMIWVTTDPVAQNLISGRPTNGPTPTQPTLALFPATTDARETSANQTAIKLAVI